MTYDTYKTLEQTQITLNNTDLWINLGFIGVIIVGLWLLNFIKKKI